MPAVTTPVHAPMRPCLPRSFPAHILTVLTELQIGDGFRVISVGFSLLVGLHVVMTDFSVFVSRDYRHIHVTPHRSFERDRNGKELNILTTEEPLI